MEVTFSAEAGIWRVTQTSLTMEMVLTKYGHVVERWIGDKMYTFDELNDILIKKSYERRGEY